MITGYKIRIFNRYDGDIDSWARSGSKKEKLFMNDDDWYMIDTLIQDLSIVRKGLASEEFKNTLNSKLKESCDNEETIIELQNLANKR